MFFNHTNILKLVNLYKIAKNRHTSKKNIQQFLKNKLKENGGIKISYDVQSGDYIEYYNKLSKNQIDKVYYPIVKAIEENFYKTKTILDFGCGELTTSHYIFNNLKKKISKYFVNDNSLNRLIIGKNYLKKRISKKNFNKFNIFCNANHKLPFKNNSIDLGITIHSLEPNNRYKTKIFDELFRISRLGIILMEPHYEISSEKQKKRMLKYDYVRGIEKMLRTKKIKYKVIKKKYHINKNNISSLFIIEKKNNKKKNNSTFVDPTSLTKLKVLKNYYYSKDNLRIFPIIEGIKIFNDDTQLFLPSLKIK